jgi:hypothetical protein
VRGLVQRDDGDCQRRHQFKMQNSKCKPCVDRRIGVDVAATFTILVTHIAGLHFAF